MSQKARKTRLVRMLLAKRALMATLALLSMPFVVHHGFAQSSSQRQMCEVPSDPVAAAPILALNQELREVSSKESSEQRVAAIKKILGSDYNVFKKTAKERIALYPEMESRGLSLDEVIAVIGYTYGEFYEVNKALRNCDPEKLKEVRPYIDVLNSALSKLPDYEGSVKRGFNVAPGKFTQAAAQFEIGKTVLMSSFVSTSTDRPLPGNVKMELLSKHGKAIAKISFASDENEVLFKSGTKFKVLDKKATFCNESNPGDCSMYLILIEADE